MSGAAHALDAPLAFLGSRLRHDVSLAGFCTYRVGGSAARFVQIEDAEELRRVAAALASLADGDPVATTAELAVLVVGRGSNLLVADEGLPGLTIQLGGAFATVEVLDHSIVRAGGASTLPVVARRSVGSGLSGFEWAVGVPGSIGGAVRMNAGGHGADMSDALRGVRVVDLSTGEDVVVPPADLDLGYRRSSISAPQIVVHADLALAPGDRAVGEQRVAEIVRWRREHQPGGSNAGSVFTNPPGDSAGRLIDAAGCKALRIGSAQVSTKHANFIQADPGGRAGDVVAVMRAVVERVQEHSAVRLHAETVLVGFPEATAAELGAAS